MKISSLLPFVLLCFLSWSHAQIETRGGQIEVALVSEVRTIVPGQSFTVALRLDHAPGWHSYWKHPGLVGMAPSLEWKLPEGFQAGPIQWPAPERVKMLSINAHGFTGEVLLLVDITPPKALAPGEVQLSAEASWMTCSKSCHPGYGTLSLSLPVGESTAWDPNWRNRFEEVRAAKPKLLEGWTVTRRTDAEGALWYRLHPEDGQRLPEDSELYFFAYGLVDTDEPQQWRRTAEGGAEWRVVPLPVQSQAVPSAGLVYLSTGWPGMSGNTVAEIRID